MFSIILQLAGAILLAYGLAFRKRKEIIEQSTPKALIESENSIVPPIIKDKWNETFLCRYGLIYTIIGYAVDIIEEDLLPKLELAFPFEFIIISVFVLILTLVTIIVSSCQAKEKYDETSFDDLLKNAGPNMLMFSEVNESERTIPERPKN